MVRGAVANVNGRVSGMRGNLSITGRFACDRPGVREAVDDVRCAGGCACEWPSVRDAANLSMSACGRSPAGNARAD